MTAAVIDGNAAAAELVEQLRRELKVLSEQGARPGLATVLAGRDYAAHAYERRVRRLAEELGVPYVGVALAADAEEADVLAAVGALNADPRISGILLLRPLPPQVNEVAVYRMLDPAKDIEAVHPVNAGLLAQGRPRFVPSTPAAVFALLDRQLRAAGAEPAAFAARSVVTVVGRSNNVGKPAALLAMARGATVVSCDVHTYQAGRLAELASAADVLIVAAGVPGLITAEHVRPGAIVLDVGINPVRDPSGRTRLVGDVAFADVARRAAAITPVPGGVGPVTDVWLLHNTVIAASLAAGIERAEPTIAAPWSA